MKVNWPNGSSTILKAMPTNGLAGSGSKLELLIGMLPILGLDRSIKRRREIPGNGVEQQLHALVLIGRSHVDRGQILRLHGIADDRVDQFLGNALFRQEQLHQLVAIHRQAFEHLLPGGVASSANRPEWLPRGPFRRWHRRSNRPSS